MPLSLSGVAGANLSCWTPAMLPRATTSGSAAALLAALSLALTVGCGKVARPDGGEGLLPVGASAPDFEARDAKDATVRFSTTGGTRVVYFYPKDATPGCTKEACAFRDAFDRYTQEGVTIFGVSGDSHESHAEYRKEHSLPFPLAADESGSVQKAYGVPSRLGMPARVTFVVDADGKVKKVFQDVDPGVHADEVLAATK
jgi:peroxiredoxin Q/BCP